MAISKDALKHSCRILMVDDNAAGLSARKAVLQELGYVVTTAADAQQALATFAAEPYPIVVTDYRMPYMTGLELIQALRIAAPATKIILISGFVNAMGMTESSTGADVVIEKSANEVEQLVRAVNRMANRPMPRKPPLPQRAPRVKKHKSGL